LSSAIRATDWRAATVTRIAPETPRAATLTLDVPGWNGHRAGQHVDVRLTAEDGYRAQRSYSIASAPGAPLQITVEELLDGEVSPWMVSVAREGDEFEIRGPFGGWFVWDPRASDPLLLIAGGSGLVPLMSMLRHRRAAGAGVPARLDRLRAPRRP
jgi:ferredoxin-NADP reductase